MKKKSIQIEIPDYLSIKQYKKISQYTGESELKRVITIISALTGIEEKEIGYWSIDSIKEVYLMLNKLGDPKNEFHSLVEWNGTLYGYAHIKNSSLGEYVDLENLCQDVKGNLHKIAALIYRPVVKNKFNSLDFIVKQSIKVAKKSGVANVFDYYTVEEYDSDKRKEVEDSFENFPVHIALGAISFFLSSASLYLNSIAYSEKTLTKSQMKRMNNKILTALSQATGAGGGLSIHSLKPIYYQYQETSL